MARCSHSIPHSLRRDNNTRQTIRIIHIERGAIFNEAISDFVRGLEFVKLSPRMTYSTAVVRESIHTLVKNENVLNFVICCMWYVYVYNNIYITCVLYE